MVTEGAYRSWLPAGALDRPAIDAALDDAARAWSAKWFARGQVRPLGRIAPLVALAGKAEWLALESGAAIAIQSGARHALAAMMLGVAPNADFATDADARVVADLSNACIDDLCRRVAQLFRLPDDSSWVALDPDTLPDCTAPRGCGLGADKGAPLLRVIASTDLTIASIKAGLMPPPKRTSLPPRTTGLAAQPVAISALIGRCHLPLSDFAGLAVGDVLVFDRALDAPLDLCLGNDVTPVGACTVTQAGDRLNLDILAPLNR